MKLPFWPNPTGYRNIDLGLSRVIDLLGRVGNPHQKLPPTIHIAGTNGKGSTLAFLRAILEENGRSVHCYTSPHLVEFNERIVLAGEKISDDFLNECLLACKNACEIEPKITPTYFEGITVAAFLAFSKIKADFLLLETGMGGRLDATNVIEKNLCTIITPISFDHTEFLGDSLAKIALEKASIIKKNCPVFVGKQDREALAVIKDYAKKMNSPTKIFGEDFDFEILENDWKFTVAKNFKPTTFFAKLFCINKSDKKLREKFTLPFPKFLAGDHQMQNASLAISCAISKNLAFVKENRIKSALLRASWPARLQKITFGRLFAKIAQGEVFLDGSHNLAGAATVFEFLRSKHAKKRILIFSMLKDKDCEGFLRKIRSEIDFLITLPIENEPKSRSGEEIVKIAQSLSINSIAVGDFDEAFDFVAKLDEGAKSGSSLDKNKLVLVCGSLYLAGNFLEKN